MAPGHLSGKIAIVAGASRGCGRGIAVALGDAGATVYVTGRTTQSGPNPIDSASGTIEEVAEQVERRGGKGIAVPVDFADPDQVTGLFERVRKEHGTLDVAACAVWGGNERAFHASWKRPFWEQPNRSWHEFVDAGPRAFWLCAYGAAGMMARQPSTGLIVGISEPIFEGAFEGQQSSTQDTFCHLGHYAINRLVNDLAKQAQEAGIAIVGLLPGFMRTERVEMHLAGVGEDARQQLRYDLAESPEYAGRAVVALASDTRVIERAGNLLYVADLAEEYGFSDVDGKRVGNFYRALGLIS